MKVCQFLSVTFSEKGGGERVQEAIFKTLKAKLYTFKKRIRSPAIEQVGAEHITRFMLSASKT